MAGLLFGGLLCLSAPRYLSHDKALYDLSYGQIVRQRERVNMRLDRWLRTHR
jgi:hypothetical protein